MSQVTDKKQEENNKKKLDNRYIFPNWLAKTMSSVDFRTQSESAILSMTLLIIGMILMVVYMAFFTEQTLTFKILMVINLICGMLFMGSSLITSYQQYKSYMDTMGISVDAEKKKKKERGNIFKRIKLAWQERKKKKLSQEAIQNIGTLMETSGAAKEVSPEEKALEEEIDEIMQEVKNDDNKLKGGKS